MQAASDLILLEHHARVAHLVLNRPDKKNALSVDLRDAVSDALERLAADDAIRCVILSGSGKDFSAGFDLGEFTRAAGDPHFERILWASSDRYHRLLLNFPLPLIAAVRGVALGGGMDTAVLCDVRIAGESARFGHPEAAFGDVVYAPLHDIIGGAAARELCLTGRIIEAGEARACGLVVQVVEDDVLMATAMATATAIARAPRETLKRTKSKFIARAAVTFDHTRAL